MPPALVPSPQAAEKAGHDWGLKKNKEGAVGKEQDEPLARGCVCN